MRREYHAKRDALRETSLVSLAPQYCLTIESSSKGREFHQTIPVTTRLDFRFLNISH